MRHSWRLTWGHAAVLLSCTVAVALAIGFVGWAAAWKHDDTATPRPVTNLPGIVGPPPPKPAMPTASARLASLPGTDDRGWTAPPGARCDSGTPPAVMGRTAKSVVVVCQVQPGNFYYRGVRLSDGAGIELANAVRSSDGFDVVNPVDGTRYQVRPTGISITSPGGQVYPEPMIEYWAS